MAAGWSESKAAGACAEGDDEEDFVRSFLRKRACVVLGLSGYACCTGPGDEGGQVGPDLGAKLSGAVGRGGSGWDGGDDEDEAPPPPRSLRTPFMEE